jgi:branched-subunit amino acid aminotransferase/4-amino-4-deoxychorismate lyase
MNQVWCNGQWIDAFDMEISPTDRGLMHGLGLFETILAVDGWPVFLDRHLARLERSCGRLGWRIEIPAPRETIARLLARNDFHAGRVRIRLAVTGGSGPIHDLAAGGDRMIWMIAQPVADSPAAGAVNLSPWARNERSPLVGLKCASYAENILALDHARRLGFEETIGINTAGHLCEAATSNLFLVKNGALLTPSLASGCLPGITRAVVIEQAAMLGIPCRECDLAPAELDTADELFLTSSIRGLMGVSRLIDRSLPPGEITARLREAWWLAATAGQRA